ncbi:MAG: D-glycero-beta-D-manno-heptose 1-phosphate adenylyltransferase [Bacteroidia bacterium]
MEWSQIIADKLYADADQLKLEVAKWQTFNDKVVFTNGCFDLLHLGHMDYLAKAADCGDRLIIGLNSDSSVSQLKGNNRPIIDEHSRAVKLASLAFVDAVVLFSEETPLELIKMLEPDVLVKGGDYEMSEIVGANEILKSGGEVRIIPFLAGYSSTHIIDKVKKA